MDPENVPPFGEIVGVATVSAKVTLRVNTVDLVIPPPVDVNVTGYIPAGVAPLVFIVSIVEQVGVQDVEENDAVAPEGSPETLNETP